VSRFSKGEVDRLGERLRAGEVSVADLTMLGLYRDEHLNVLLKVLLELASLRNGARLTARQKNAQTILGKLRVHAKMQLSNMQDIAGARLIVGGGRRRQDAMVRLVCDRFPGHKAPKDRRADPTHGYRAVHIVVPVNDYWAEVQVRTPLQDRWAQTFERLGDQWGRQIRFGGMPDIPNETTMVAGASVSRAEVVEYMRDLSDMIDDVEVEQVRVMQIVDDFHRDRAALANEVRDARHAEMLAANQEVGRRLEDIDSMFAAMAEAVPVGPPHQVRIEHATSPALEPVQHFLVVYRRLSGVLESVRAFAGAELDQAVALRSELEQQHRTDPDLEVVLLASASERDIRATHARYFESVGELTRKKDGESEGGEC
jgi:ppGpp synthetase/RelA/SpoT-type nucleotidyltranferase